MQKALTESTGLKDLQQKIVAYWTLATHSLPNATTFPLLALVGKMGTGKSQALCIIGNFARRSVRLSLRGMTTPTIRDKFADSYNGTAIVEEADSAWKDPDTTFERLLSDRYQRASAEAFYKVKSGDKNWSTATKQYFGATALHRRIPFRDAALDGRTVCARTRPDHTRRYREFKADDPWNSEGKEIVRDLTFQPLVIEQPQAVAARVFDTYQPLLSAAKLCADDEFGDQLLTRLRQETLELKKRSRRSRTALFYRPSSKLFLCWEPQTLQTSN